MVGFPSGFHIAVHVSGSGIFLDGGEDGGFTFIRIYFGSDPYYAFNFHRYGMKCVFISGCFSIEGSCWEWTGCSAFNVNINISDFWRIFERCLLVLYSMLWFLLISFRSYKWRYMMIHCNIFGIRISHSPIWSCIFISNWWVQSIYYF